MDEHPAQHPASDEAREAFRTRLFLLMLEIAGIFLIPALAAVWIGRHLDAVYGIGTAGMVVSLALAFVLSWILVAIRYRRAMRERSRFSPEKR